MLEFRCIEYIQFSRVGVPVLGDTRLLQLPSRDIHSGEDHPHVSFGEIVAVLKKSIDSC